jgi:hypothetical protein
MLAVGSSMLSPLSAGICVFLEKVFRLYTERCICSSDLGPKESFYTNLAAAKIIKFFYLTGNVAFVSPASDQWNQETLFQVTEHSLPVFERSQSNPQIFGTKRFVARCDA